MLRECMDHGYFRDETCKLCGNEGRFMLNSEELNQIGRMMAGILRHFPEKFHLKMDEQGWVSLNHFVSALKKRRRNLGWLKDHHIKAVIDTDPKGRYQYDTSETHIRATYAHSFPIDIDLPTDNIPLELYYPASQEEAEILVEAGLKPVDRNSVHLSLTAEDAYIAGSHRLEDPVILIIDTVKANENGVVIKRAARTVFITKEIPADYLTIFEGEIDHIPQEDVDSFTAKRTSIKEKAEKAKAAELAVAEEKTAEAEKPPVEEKVAPAKAEKPPVEVEVTPAKAEKPPVEEEAKPAKAEKPLVEEEAKPAKAEKPPVEEEAKPAKAEKPPVEEEATPVKVEKPSVKEEVSPAKAEKPPVEEEVAPVKVEKPPVRKEAAPVKDVKPAVEDTTKTTVEEKPPVDE